MDVETRRCVPQFKASVEPFVDPGQGLFLLSEGQRAWLPNPIYSAIAPMLDGARTVEAIVEALSKIYSEKQVLKALNNFREHGYLADDASIEPRPARAFWEQVGVPPGVAQARLANAKVSIAAFGDVETEFLASALERTGVSVAPDGNFAVVVTDDYLRPELAAWNRDSLASGQPWLLVKPVGIETWNGPAFVPGRTGCWECLAQRLRGHRRLERYIAQRKGIDAPLSAPVAFLSLTQHAVLSEAATEVVRLIATGGQSWLLEKVISTNVLTLARVSHPLTRRPQCLACGRAEPNRGDLLRPLNLCNRRKVRDNDGGHRAVEAEEAIARLERHVSPITGIVSAIVPGKKTGIARSSKSWVTPIFTSDHNFSDMHNEDFFLRDGLRLRSGGKGKSSEQARISALAESLERYSGVFDGTEPRIRASFADLGSSAIHPNVCMGYSERQYANRLLHNRGRLKARWVPEPFREDVAIEWTPLWSLTSGVTRYLPTSYCYYGYRSSDPDFSRGDSNGCAAGSVVEEAVLQGFLELVERDAVALWWYNRLRRPALNLEDLEDPYIPTLKDHYKELGRNFWVLDVTSDLGIATFAAISKRTDTAEEDIIHGFGAHLDPGIALTRALTEMNQSLEAVPISSGGDSTRTYLGHDDSIRWWRTVKVADANYLMGHAEAGSCLQDFKNLASDDLYQDIVTCKELARARGIELLVLEQTRPDVGLPVVRVVAPGLRHFWPRFGPGRLYDVPAREGWLSRPITEQELNPFAILL
jgi:bacteriocin biosynthesis cyclodehydratase domain-containing protein